MSHQHDHGRTEPPVDIELRIRALRSLLQEKGLIDPTALDELIDTYGRRVGPCNGAQVAAKAWSDPEYERRLLVDITATIAKPGFSDVQGKDMQIVESTPDMHNATVCTLCFCYPRPVLGLPPMWYRPTPYRSRVVIDPRGVLAEFEVNIPESREVRVWDSSMELHYLILPERLAGTDGWSKAQLIGLVTRDSMIGTDLVAAP